MSETLEYKIYKLGGKAHRAALAYHQNKDEGESPILMHLPGRKWMADALGFHEGVQAAHPEYGYSFVYPRTRQSPLGKLEFFMECPVGIRNDGTKGHFVPQDSQEIDLGVSAFVLMRGGKLLFERDPITLRLPDSEPEPELLPEP